MKNLALLIVALLLLNACGSYEKPPLIERSLKESVILSRVDGKYQVETSETAFDLLNTNGESLIENGVVNVRPTNNYEIFKAQVGNDQYWLGERNLNVDGVPNLRDVGGLRNKEGYQMKWGKIFRSGKLAEVNTAEFDRLEGLGLNTIVDFRTSEEKEKEPDQWPNMDQLNRVELPIGDKEGISQREMLKALNKEDFDADQFMYNASKGFVNDYTDQYKAFFKTLLQEDSYPLLFHCSAGKDRAGMGSYLILSALGMADDQKMSEYLLSNFYLQHNSESDIKKAAKFYGIDQDKLRTLMKVKEIYMQGALDAIQKEYGDVQTFLCKALEVCAPEVEQLKKMLLYDYKTTYDSKVDSQGVELPSNSLSYRVEYLMEGAPNFRQYNLPVDDALQIQPNKLFRSNALGNLTSKDLRKLENMGLKTIVDFRYKEELDDDPDKKPATVVNYVNPQITRSKNDLADQIDSAGYMALRTWYIEGDFEKVDSFMAGLNIDFQQARIERYQSFALDFTESYSTFMKTLADPENYPIVYHCQGGKDRAGFASAVLLKTLGYDDQAIVDDFLTTNLHTYDELEAYKASGVESLDPTMGAHSEHLMAAFRAVDLEYGSFKNYLTEGLKLSAEELLAIRTNLLVPNSQ